MSDLHPTSQEPDDPDADEDLLQRLGTALDAADRLPPTTASTARDLLRWRSDDADLALLGLAEPAPVRSGSTLQIHRFSTGDVDVELVVDGTSVSGVIEPWPPGTGSDSGTGSPETGSGASEPGAGAAWRATIERLDGPDGGTGPGAGSGRGHTVEVDDDGEFDVELEGGGPIRVVLTCPSRRVRTEWVLTG